MRLSDEDAQRIAQDLSDDAAAAIEWAVGGIEMGEYERLADDLADGFRRVLLAAEIFV